MLSNRHPADQLADILIKIRYLKREEAKLRAAFLKGEMLKTSEMHEVIVRQSNRRVFLRDKLPADILNNPEYWEQRTSKTVVLKRLNRVQPQVKSATLAPVRAIRPGDPSERAAPVLPTFELNEEDEFDVIERFEPGEWVRAA